jgi:cobyric acid synthase
MVQGTMSSVGKSWIVNKFRGDARWFEDGVKILEQRGGVPVLGVIPFIHDLRIAEEDAVALDAPTLTRPLSLRRRGSLDIAVMRLPHISNFDDFDPLRAEAAVQVRFVDRVDNYPLCLAQRCFMGRRRGRVNRGGASRVNATWGIDGRYLWNDL